MFDPVIVRYQIRAALLYWLLIPAFVVLSGKLIDTWREGTRLLLRKCSDIILNLFGNPAFKYSKSVFWHPNNMILAVPNGL